MAAARLMGPRTLTVPPAIRSHLAELVRLRFTGRDPEPALAALPRELPEATVTRLASGGPFGWLIEARLDEIDGRLALEALEDDRMSGPSHYRVWEDGVSEPLPNEHIGYGVPKDCPPEEVERIKERHHLHNREVQALLRERGFPA